jgi:hypothetical protein
MKPLMRMNESTIRPVSAGRRTTRTCVAALIVLLSIGAAVCSCETGFFPVSGAAYDSELLYAPEELQEDFFRFRSILETKAVKVFTDRKRLSGILDEAEARLTAPMTELEFLRLLAPITAELRCGHSFLSVSAGCEAYMRERAAFFPLEVGIVAGRLFVLDDPHGSGAAPGSEILSIDGRPADAVVRVLTGNMTTDGHDRGRPRHDAERWFASMYFTYIDAPDAFTLELLPPGAAAAETIYVPAVRDPALAKTAQGVVHDTVDTPYSYTFNRNWAYLSVPVFSYSDNGAYRQFLRGFFEELAERGLEVLVLDLRGNYGGSPGPTAELLQYLIDRPVRFFADNNPFYLIPWERDIRPAPAAFTGRLFVLTDEACFSMTGFLLSILKHHRIGTLVGAPSSGGPVCSDASRNAVLPNTGLRLRYSTQKFTIAAGRLPPGYGVEPDIPVARNLDDLVSGRDAVLEAALSAAGISVRF